MWLSLVMIIYNFGNSFERLGEVREYCEAEAFKASCEANEVVIIDSARYGRMHEGRCVHKNYGYVGCNADVRAHMDNTCSGRRSCEIRIPDSELDNINPCPEDFKTFLEAAYSCIKVHNPPCRPCRNYTEIIPSSRLGYIGSIVSEESACGTRNCPFVLRAKTGQRFNLTLYDFAVPNNKRSTSFHSSSDKICYKYADISEIIKSKDKKVQKEIIKEKPVCRGNIRMSHIFSSLTHEVKIEISGVSHSRVRGHFMIKYEVLGCEDYGSPPNTWIKREGDRTLVGCVSTGEQWKLTCIDSKWNGDVGACPIGLPRSASSLGSSSMLSIPTGILIAVILAIAMVIGVCILTAGLVVIKKRRLSNLNNSIDQPQSTYMKSDYMDPRVNHFSTPTYSTSNDKIISSYPEVYRNDYMPKSVIERPLPSVPNRGQERFEPIDDISNIYAPPYHPYEISPGSYDSQSRHYFELDPNSNQNNTVIPHGYNGIAQRQNFNDNNCNDFNAFTMAPNSASCDNEYTETGNFSWP